ncbi:MAG: hypothetical protein COB98_03730 [Flavobacteriaceae bacterium]|nr:MAG: hypothetical protein COB98_03730 [Flavobacteriaceae bacterium]
MSKYYCPLLFFGFFMCTVMAQNEPVNLLNVPTHNMIKFNRNLVNPTFSIVGETASNITIYNRRQWIEFDNSPETYMLNYSGVLSDNVGVGINIYQQNSGVMKNFGVSANYAYRFKMRPKVALTLGFNTGYYSSGLNDNAISSGVPDPALQGVDNSAIFKFMPGGNLTIGKFDIGVYAENLVDYNLKTSESLTDFGFRNKTFTGHLMYTQPLYVKKGLFKESKIRMSISNRRSPERGDDLSGSLLLDLPKLGWIQGGYSDFYGYSIGLGINVSKNISFGYTIEKGLAEGIKNFGPTHEFVLAYSFKPRKKGLKIKKEVALKEIDSSLNIKETSLKKKEILKKEVEAFRKKQATMNLKEVAATGEVKPVLNDSNGIPYQYLGKLKNVTNGYYIVTSIFKNEAAAKNKVALLKSQNRKAAYFKNSNNGNFYVYLDSFLSWKKAKDTVRSSYNNSYKGNLWIMDVSGKLVVEKKQEKTKKIVVKPRAFTKVALVENPVKIRNVAMEISTVTKGNYLIASVFSKKSNADRFVEKLRARGVKANYFINPKNNYHYVYLAHNKDKNTVRKAYYSHVNNTFFGEMWIMTIHLPKHVTIDIKTQQSDFVIANVPQGYYLVVNVFKNKDNFTNFIAKLKRLGFAPKYITNPKNGWRYVYLKYATTKSIVTAAYHSNSKNSYKGDKWVMSVRNE